MKRIYQFAAMCFALAAGTLAAVAGLKLLITSAGIDAILNVATNCGPESAAGGLGAGAGSLACGDSGLAGPGTVADNSISGVGGVAGGNRGPAYDTLTNYRNNLNQRAGREATSPSNTSNENTSSQNLQPDSNKVNDSPTKQGPAPASIEFPDEKQGQA